MNKRIRSMIDTIFCEMKMTAENLALRDELMANAQARFEDAIAQGKTEEEAFGEVAASLEDVNDLLREMNAEAPMPDEEAPAQQTEDQSADAEPEVRSEEPRTKAGDAQTDLGDALNKAFSALGSWGQSIMPQAKNLAKQMDDATGGMLSDIGRAVNKSMQDAQKAASDVLDKYQRPAADASFTGDKTPEELREDAKDLRAQAELKRVTGDAQGAQALDMQADALETQADVLEQSEAIRQAQKAAEDAAPSVTQEEIFGADGELDESAFSRSVDQMTRDAEDLLHDATGTTLPPQENEIRFPVAGLRKIDAKLDADDVIIEPIDGDVIIVRWSAKDAESAPDVTMQNHALTIRRKNPDVFKTFFSVFSKDGGQITILVPRGYAADYALSATSGGVRLSGVDVDDVKISTTSGDVRVEPDNSTRARDIHVESISGNVTVSAMAVSISAQSVSGEVFISCDAGSVEGNVVSGILHIEGAFDSLDTDAVSGETKIICTVPPTGKIKADSLSGGIMLFLPSSIRGFAVEFDSMSGHMANEFGPSRFGTCALPIEVSTVSGSLTIARL